MDGSAIRKHIEALGPRKRGGQLPENLRREVADYARRRRLEGGRVSEIARETGVSGESVRRWSSAKQTRLRALVPVRVRTEAARQDGIVIHTAQGHRVTGLDVGVGARILGFKRPSVEPLALLEVDGPRSQHEVESPSEV